MSELPRGEPLREALIKALTGGEPTQVRHLHKGFFDMYPTFKAMMSGNDLPQVGGVDHGIWRRLRLIPWSVTISDAEKRPMEQVLAEFEAERSGILNWLIEGLRRYMSEGLRAPPEVLAATLAYREEMDPVGGFITDCVERSPLVANESVTAREMYEAFVSWCHANAVRPWKEATFGRVMPQKGFLKTSERIRRYLDVRLHDVPARNEGRAPEPPHPADDA
ncbi:DNA primase family protein [Rhodoligotrophos appendicifer]|uniref:DNA primase family protein n=1 Tax=Rhodoligotrophos appendicifer TaxID=987056 RepID=UPI0011852D54|nr:phage/plasmid primase, P4 family [Rhodoligotrophos appendicifer]